KQLDEHSKDFSVIDAGKRAKEVLSVLIAMESEYVPYKDLQTLIESETVGVQKISSEDVEPALLSFEKALVRRISPAAPSPPPTSFGEALSDRVKELSKMRDMTKYQDVIRCIESLRLSDPSGDSFESTVDELQRQLDNLFGYN